MLQRSDFRDGVKAALRHYVRTDLLAENALLNTELVARSGSGADAPKALKVIIVETARTLFANERDRKLYRALDLTYFNPARKQETAAEQLGVSFSTYRRSLAAAVERLAEWLWQQEQRLRTVQPTAGLPSATALDATADTFTSARPRLSIVVLPFLNLSQDASVEYLVDGIVDTLITDLSSCLPGSFVISRSTSFTYKGRSVPIRQIGRELGVRYVLEGSVLIDVARLRVNAQLIDAETDVHLWAERFDKPRTEILQVHDEIVGRLSRSVGIQLVRTEAGRGGPERNGSDVIDLLMRARALISDTKREEITAEAVNLFHQALQRDADCVDAMVGVSLARTYQVINLYNLDDRESLLDEAATMISRAAALAPDSFDMHKARALLLRARGRFSDAIIATEALIARNPAEPTAYKEMGLNKLYLGQTREAAEWFRRADMIAPRDPERWTWLQGLGRALMQLGDDADAVVVLSQALASNPGYVRGKAMLAAAQALAGDIEAARQHLAEYRMLEPNMTVGRFAKQRSSVPPESASVVYRQSERILEGLRRAGMPDGCGI
ncbi:MAG TPA: tetratricopeptide repeat protein [Acetobacteraceae bacterium]|nr:tetratricopeptide repeat protein [Acetobacteraceae bacterium]